MSMSRSHNDWLPNVFCWSKMQAESGQPLEAIIRRKEAERLAGSGLFFWGVGNSLGRGRIAALLQRTPTPTVAFSIMRAPPKHADIAPSEVLMWRAYLDDQGTCKPLPAHVLVISRGRTATREKRYHYALVCRAERPLRLDHHGKIDLGQYRNLGSSKPTIGYSQVTAVLERHSALQSRQEYDVHLVASLTEPYFVRLADARPLTSRERDAVAHASSGCTTMEWINFVSELRSEDRHPYASGASGRC